QTHILTQISHRLNEDWKALRDDPLLDQVLTDCLGNPEMQAAAIETIAAAQLTDHSSALLGLCQDTAASEVVRGEALKALGKLAHPQANELALSLIRGTADQPQASPLVIAAIETLATTGRTTELREFLTSEQMPLDVRRRALQLNCVTFESCQQILSMQEAHSIPADLKNELIFLLHNHSDRRVRQLAQTRLPQANNGTSQRIHSFQDILQMQGNATRGEALFARHPQTLCARCHRVTGEGALVGPDLASIGTKYDARELLYHVQSPSGAVNYNFVSHTLLLKDGRVLTGLVLNRQDGRIMLGLATGQQETIAAVDVEEESPQAISLMPEGLLNSLSTQEVADLLEYLQSLRKGDAGITPATTR
ncbi:MAG: c-type cytochrome, partial [Planctomycetaceae bacterium]|nr:c-type cytochrome [Planctomycetaceae bacterium]